ncbi:MAG: GFA family protein [Lentisphaerae bacterium]|jgi:hypothetical protein|nr:GFA family protein [Lentisphaerota bacterium]MBT5605032.1 GFA family protein [Lentisphaerota bacterium]MBT7058654.1 GFA family protein [Lentisphaerota bacterium]MBT7846995.1 GFA family protein [Lentisphaerota bacterium]
MTNTGPTMMVTILAALMGAGVAIGQDAAKAGDDTKKAPAPKSAAKPFTGRCHCGAVTYRVKGAVVKSSYCDCPGCRRATGTLRAPFVTVLRKDLESTAGKTTEFKAAGGVKCDVHGTWHFCPKCGTHLFWKGHRGKEIDIFAGTLDDPAVFKPKAL